MKRLVPDGSRGGSAVCFFSGIVKVPVWLPTAELQMAAPSQPDPSTHRAWTGSRSPTGRL